MKIAIAFTFITVFSICSFSQVSKIISTEKKISNKIEIGMSGDEVKKIVGRPKAIESGFPDTEESIIEEFPSQVGQLNCSTWFYFYNAITISTSKTNTDSYYINDLKVSEDEFNKYKEQREIIIYENKIIDPLAVEWYKNNLDSTKIKIQLRNDIKTFIVKGKPYIERKKLVPILCVIFDKGTQVVASKKVLFKYLE